MMKNKPAFMSSSSHERFRCSSHPDLVSAPVPFCWTSFIHVLLFYFLSAFVIVCLSLPYLNSCAVPCAECAITCRRPRWPRRRRGDTLADPGATHAA